MRCIRHLALIANRWNRQLGIDAQYPPDLEPFLAQCHAAGQTRPTPLILLSEPGRDFTGGESVMTETSSSGQHADVVALNQGDAVVLAVNQRPAPYCRPEFSRRTLIRP